MNARVLWDMMFQLSCPGGTPYDGQYGEAPPKEVPFSHFRYMKGQGFRESKYMKG